MKINSVNFNFMGSKTPKNINREIKKLGRFSDVCEDEFIRDVKPIDSRDLVDVVIINDAPKNIRKVLETLTPVEETVLKERFGFDDEPKSRAMIAKKYGVSVDMIRHIEQKALKLLRHPSRSRELRDILDSYNKK